ncbi:hypothetical protein JG687_00002088 [Phytophthora cactorum]|uniref:Fibronectin type-III domain-containing protein n=1 Tax=Phytophthora cactorum TaxID=29920 RepID=A0A8T1UZD1_9STRA|nr:hypothetical protein JG687_00002088 [Phytophthora cactorum]
MLRDTPPVGRMKLQRRMLLHLIVLLCCITPRPAMAQGQVLSWSGCACQPTVLAGADSPVTCYQRNSMFGCAVDPSDSCADGGLNRTWDLCNVVDVYLVTDRSSSTASTGSLYVTLYGEDLVVLKTTELSSEILRKKISKVSLPLDNPAAVRTIKIEAAARVSLRIFEVQTIVNDLPPTIFAPPTPGQISFVGNEDIASTGIVSLWFVPVKQFLNGAALSQCLFDSVTVLMNGVEMADGRLSKENCDVPAYAYLQLGRDTMNIRPETSVLQGAMDENGKQSESEQDIIAIGSCRGAIKLELEEPLDTGGLPIAQYNVFFLRDGAYEKLTSIVASRTSENTTITVTRDANGNPLLPLTTYTFKVLALQANMGCDTLTGDDLESDAVSATTDVAAIPAPPSRPVLLLGSKCFALVTVAPPDDFGGAYVTGMTIGIFLSTGALHESFSVTLFPGEITIRNLLAYSSYAVKAALNTTIGDSGFGEALVFTTKDPSPPGKLTLLEITDLGSSSLIVRWKGPQDTGGGAISGYLLYQRAITATGTQDLIYNGSTDASKTSFLVGGLLASTKYVFAAIPVNQYGLAGMDDDHLVYATTFGQEVPFPPTDIKDSKVDAGYVELSFSEPFYTGGLHFSSTYFVALATVNDKGSSSYSSSIVVTTGEARRPGFPQLELISASGGSISLKWSLPEMAYNGTGYQSSIVPVSVSKPNTAYTIRAQDLKITIFRLGADTTYDVVAISHLEDSANVLTWGKISVSDSRITLSDNVTTDIVNSGYFEFGGYLFEVDTTQAQSNNTITYSASLSTDVGAIATTNLQNGDEYDVYVRGAFSDVANYTTAAPTRPGMPPISDLDYATGGALHVRISWPDDTDSRKVANVFWEAEDDAVNYRLFRDGELYIDNGEDITVCERCPKNMYSLDGLKCFYCPSGAKCNMTVRRATDTIAEELGTVSPRTEEGFYLFSAPATKQKSSCNKPSQWKNEDPCKKLALENPRKNLSDVIYECSNLNDFNVYWSADRLFSCLSGKIFYTCDVSL